MRLRLFAVDERPNMGKLVLIPVSPRNSVFWKKPSLKIDPSKKFLTFQEPEEKPKNFRKKVHIFPPSSSTAPPATSLGRATQPSVMLSSWWTTRGCQRGSNGSTTW